MTLNHNKPVVLATIAKKIGISAEMVRINVIKLVAQKLLIKDKKTHRVIGFK